MTAFAGRCGVHDAAREAACERLLRIIDANRMEQVRFVWCDLHGVTRGKTLMASAVARALREGVGMVSTLMLKDTSDRTAYPVFERDGTAALPGFGQANNLLLLADPTSFKQLPWAPNTGWLQCQPWFDNGTPVELDTRRVLQHALARLASAGFGLRCGLEVEFHIYRVTDTAAQLEPAQAAWPGQPPALALVHPGYNLLGEAWADMADEPLRVVQNTAQALGLPLTSLEIELGPSQVEAVFEATDALTAADNMVVFRNAVKQALRRAGYHATFMCRPPFPNIMSSGWHLHQSLIRLPDAASSLVEPHPGTNAFVRSSPAPGTSVLDASHTLSDAGAQYLAGLLAHARGVSAFCTPTANGYGRFRPHALAPQSILWGRDNRGAMLRVIGAANDNATRIENRIGEPAANPYLYIAAQIHAGLDGIQRALAPPPATQAPYGPGAAPLPTSLGEALDALAADTTMADSFGSEFVHYFTRIKQAEATRRAAADDTEEFDRREYLSRI
jgi:glutamine synthetase